MNVQKSSRFSFVMSVFLSLAFLFTTSCEKETFTPANDNTIMNTIQETKYDRPDATLEKAEVEVEAAEVPFSFRLIHADCYASGRSYQVAIDTPEEYAFVWTVNDQHAGHGRLSPSCLCDGTATIYVTRLKDGLTLSETVELSSCSNDME